MIDRQIKNCCSFIILMFVVFLLQTTVMASDSGLLSSSEETVADNAFKITSGLDVEKEKESTFDKERTITGKAEEGTKVTISVYNKETDKAETSDDQSTDSPTESTESDEKKYELEIGASGIFSQVISLKLGENNITLTVENDKYDTIVKSFVINRKNREIKQELENTIVLPGESSNKSETENSNTLDPLLKR